MNRIFGITGWKNSGKTTLMAGLISEFTGLGVTISTIKHASEQFDIDKPATDSHTHRLAGAREVAIVSPKRWAIMHETADDEETPSLHQMIERLSPCDLILVEGFKTSPHSKIECIRGESLRQSPIWQSNNTVTAIATTIHQEECELPQFDLNNVSQIAQYIAKETGLAI